MRIDIATLFPAMCEAVLSESIVGRARAAGKLAVHCHDIRAFWRDRNGRVDDTPYGGGMGMVMQAPAVAACLRAVTEMDEEKPYIIYMSPQGRVFTQADALRLREKPRLLLLCGHYEGVDERVLETFCDEELSVGDYVLTGGELPALVVTDAIARLCDGVLPDPSCYEEESLFHGLLEYPQYTRPEVWEGKPVPPVLLSGHHGRIAAWRQRRRLLRTAQKRPDLYARYTLTPEDEKLLNTPEE